MSTPEEIAEAVIGRDALAGIGYKHDFEVAVKAARAAQDESQKAVGQLVTDRMSLGNALILARNPVFLPSGEFDYHRSQWETLARHQATSLDDGNGGQYPWGRLKIEANTIMGHTNWLTITKAQAEHILAYLSTEAAANQTGEQQ